MLIIVFINYVREEMEYIDPNKLLPDRSGDYLVLLGSEFNGKEFPAKDVSRFNKKFFGSYWSLEKFCNVKIIGWKPMNNMRHGYENNN